MIDAANISRDYSCSDGSPVHALRGVSVSISAGDFVAIMGPSGSGKSTLLHVMGLLDTPDGGRLSVGGVETSGLTDAERAALRNRSIGFVFQQFNLLPRASAMENVLLPYLYAGRRPDVGRAKSLLEEVGLSRRMHHRPQALSGGEQQRVAIARALAQDPCLLLADEPTGNLDSVAAAGILDLMESLNRRGITVVMVTHDLDVARRAHRCIRMFDGRVVEDARVRPAPDSGRLEPAAAAPPRHASFSWGEWASFFREAVRSLASAKLRSCLSMLGVAIGTFTVLAMLSMITDARRAIEVQLESLGTNLLVLGPAPVRGNAPGGGLVRLTRGDAEAIERRVPSVRRAVSVVQGRMAVEAERRSWVTQVAGTESRYALMTANEPEAGRFFSDDEVARRAQVLLLGRTVCRELFGDADPLGRDVRLQRRYFRVIGVLPEKGVNPWRDQDDIVVMPVTTAMSAVFGRDDIDAVHIEVRQGIAMADAQRDIARVVAGRRSGALESSFSFRNLARVRAAFTGVSAVLSWLLGGIAGISLLVGGVGIMNIMLVSVRERTREIGLRKAIGARRADIEAQFLIEAVVLSTCGGAVGVLLGWGAAYLSTRLGWPVGVSGMAAAVALGFSCLTGILSGLWPARTAAALDPMDALRYE